MELSLALSLPRDAVTVPLARRIVRQSMGALGIDPECTSDIEVAMSEACTNVVRHSAPGDEYAVTVEIDDRTCVVEVVDKGGGFDVDTLDETSLSAEGGRGLELMRVLVDSVRFDSRPDQGTAVCLEKAIHLADRSPLRELGGRSGQTRSQSFHTGS